MSATRTGVWLGPLWLAIVLVGGVTLRADAAPIRGEIFAVPQPDGTKVQLRVWGDEFYAVAEDLEGYTVVRDESTGVICYADRSIDGTDLISTRVPVGEAIPSGIGTHIRIAPEAAREKALASREDARRRAEEEPDAELRSASRGPTTGAVVGITILVDFDDDEATIPRSTVVDYCNQPVFSGYGNNGSVRDYFYDVSNHQLEHTQYVSPEYYRIPGDKFYYSEPGYGRERVELLVLRSLDWLDDQGFDYSQYDSDGNGSVDAVNIFYAGDCWNAWGEGLWPHQGSVSFHADNVAVTKYQISPMGSQLVLGTFCHENGHLLMNWPDLYDYDFDSMGVGNYCLMGYSGPDPSNPVQPCAYLKDDADWEDVTVVTSAQMGLSASATGNRAFKFKRPGHSNEYFLIENRQRTERDESLPDQGLAVWHIDEDGWNNWQQQTQDYHYEVTLVQADGEWDLEGNSNYGDDTDLYGAPDYAALTPATNPDTDWWTGDESWFAFTNISSPGPTVVFDFGWSRPDCYVDGANAGLEDGSQEHPFDTIQEGIDAVAAGGAVWVFPGTYRGAGNKDLDFFGKTVELKSTGGQAATVIDCQLGGRAFYFHSGESSDCIVQGFKVMNGSANRGGAVYCIESSAPRFEACVFETNSSLSNHGGAVWSVLASPAFDVCSFENNSVADDSWTYGGGVYASYGVVRFTNCVFLSNHCSNELSFGGAVTCFRGTFAFENCWFEGNSAGQRGGAIHMIEAESEFTDCTFLQNQTDGSRSGYGGAISCEDTCAVTVESCVFHDNEATWGGAIACRWGSQVDLADCLLRDNTAYSGGAISLHYDCGASLTGCNLRSNHADWGGAVCSDTSEVAISECTLFANSGVQGAGVSTEGPLSLDRSILSFGVGAPIHCNGLTISPGATHCVVFGHAMGDSMCCEHFDNLFVDPLFCDQPDGDLTLHDDSPCLPGNNPWGETIGANGAGACGTDVPWEALPPSLSLRSVTPNPFTNSSGIECDIPADGGIVRVAVYDLAGRRVRLLADGLRLPGRNVFTWDGNDDAGRPVASGVYFCRVTAGSEEAAAKVVLIR